MLFQRLLRMCIIIQLFFAYFVKGLTTDTGSPCTLTLVGQWLSKLNLADYESLFVNYGYDDLEFIVSIYLYIWCMYTIFSYTTKQKWNEIPYLIFLFNYFLNVLYNFKNISWFILKQNILWSIKSCYNGNINVVTPFSRRRIYSISYLSEFIFPRK